MISFFRLLIGVLFSLTASMAFAKSTAKQVTKQPQPKLIFYKEFAKLSKQDQALYLEDLRTAVTALQPQDPTFTQFLWDSFLIDAQAAGNETAAKAIAMTKEAQAARKQSAELAAQVQEAKKQKAEAEKSLAAANMVLDGSKSPLARAEAERRKSAAVAAIATWDEEIKVRSEEANMWAQEAARKSETANALNKEMLAKADESKKQELAKAAIEKNKKDAEERAALAEQIKQAKAEKAIAQKKLDEANMVLDQSSSPLAKTEAMKRKLEAEDAISTWNTEIAEKEKSLPKSDPATPKKTLADQVKVPKGPTVDSAKSNQKDPNLTRKLGPAEVENLQAPSIDSLKDDAFVNANELDNLPTLSCSQKDSSDCRVVTKGAFELRCFYGGFAIGKSQSGKNSCSPVTGDLCDPKNTFNRDTQPSMTSFKNTLCALNPQGGKCDGGTGKISAGSMKNLIVCNPLLYGLKGPSSAITPESAHVICVKKDSTASKNCAKEATDEGAQYIEKLMEKDGGASFDAMIATMQNTCGKVTQWDAGKKSFVKSGDPKSLHSEVLDLKSAKDIQSTCITLMNRTVELREARPANSNFQKATEGMGVR